MLPVPLEAPLALTACVRLAALTPATISLKTSGPKPPQPPAGVTRLKLVEETERDGGLRQPLTKLTPVKMPSDSATLSVVSAMLALAFTLSWQVKEPAVPVAAQLAPPAKPTRKTLVFRTVPGAPESVTICTSAPDPPRPLTVSLNVTGPAQPPSGAV